MNPVYMNPLEIHIGSTEIVPFITYSTNKVPLGTEIHGFIFSTKRGIILPNVSLAVPDALKIETTAIAFDSTSEEIMKTQIRYGLWRKLTELRLSPLS